MSTTPVMALNIITVAEINHSHTLKSPAEKGFYARVLQHEIDHINGVLITDRLTPECTQESIAEMMALRRAELPDDKITVFDELLAKKFKKKD